MGLKNCEIKLDNPWNTYYAGQTINGQVVFTFDAPKKVRGEVNQSRDFHCNQLDLIEMRCFDMDGWMGVVTFDEKKCLRRRRVLIY